MFATNVYDSLGRVQTQTNAAGKLYTYYFAGSRSEEVGPGPVSKVSYMDALGKVVKSVNPLGKITTSTYDALNRPTAIKETGTVNLATYAYDDLSRRTTVTLGNSTTTSYAYSTQSALATLTHNLTGTAQDQTYTYDLDNQLISANKIGSSNSLAYDGAGRLRQTTLAGTVTGLTYDGVDLVAEYNSGGTLLRRYVHGPGVDEPLVWYEGSTTTAKSWLYADHLGSIIGTANSAGTKHRDPQLRPVRRTERHHRRALPLHRAAVPGRVEPVLLQGTVLLAEPGALPADRSDRHGR